MAKIYDYPSNVPIASVDENGASVPLPQDILGGVLEDFREAFGQHLNIQNLQTPQGFLAQELTRSIVDCFAIFADVINGVDPAYSYGKMQDAIGRIYFITRRQPTHTGYSATVDVDQSLLLPRKELHAIPEKEIARKEFMEIIIWNNSVLLQDRADLESLQNVVKRQMSQAHVK